MRLSSAAPLGVSKLVRVSLLLGALCCTCALPPSIGPYGVASKVVDVPALDASDPRMWVVYPAPVTNDTSLRFPLVSYLHGIMGGDIDLLAYTNHFAELASYGFIVAATFSCNWGCDPNVTALTRWTQCAGLPPLKPLGEGWDMYYGEALVMVDFARNASAAGVDPVFAAIDWAAGVGVAGHSMGGQGAAVAASAACASAWGIKAAALHHPANATLPWGNVGLNISVPVVGFTTSGDPSNPETEALMAAVTARPAAFRNEVGWSHLEPLLWPPCENPLLATYTAAWFKVALNNETSGEYFDLVFGPGPDSLCRHALMEKCYVSR